jgi:transposase
MTQIHVNVVKTVHPKGRRTSLHSTLAKITSARLRELFWQAPETSVLLEEAEQRITAALRQALTPEPVQLFDDLYESVGC